MTKDRKSDDIGGEGGPVPVPETDLPNRLRSLEDRLSKVRTERNDAAVKRGRLMGEGASYGKALRHVSEFVGGILAGMLLGWLVDQLTGWFPLGLVTGLILGFVTGFWNIYKSSLRGGSS